MKDSVEFLTVEKLFPNLTAEDMNEFFKLERQFDDIFGMYVSRLFTFFRGVHERSYKEGVGGIVSNVSEVKTSRKKYRAAKTRKNSNRSGTTRAFQKSPKQLHAVSKRSRHRTTVR